MLEELFNSGKLQQGHQVLMMVPESARFNYAYVLLSVV
jgi:3-oxoacyl-[acyl-carrier-protein] synthase-3